MGTLLKSLLSPDPNSPSSMRFVTLFGAVVILGVWALTCIRQAQLLDLPAGVDYALLILIGGKAGQKIFAEGQSISVPDLVGKPQAAAAATIATAGLQVGTVSTAPSTTVPPGSVISQNPAAGSSVPSGSTVTLVVAS